MSYMFTISTKAQYGLGLMQILAQRFDHGYVSLVQISRDKKYPLNYLQQVVAILKKAGLVESREGVSGGYRLTKKPGQISVLAILTALEGPIRPVPCIDPKLACCESATCLTRELWAGLSKEMAGFLGQRTLQDISKLKISPKGSPTLHSYGDGARPPYGRKTKNQKAKIR